MLSKAIKDKVENKYGSAVRYPVECDALAVEISKATGRSISSSTIKRLWGFIEGASAARSYTLDTVAEYCGHSCFDELIESFNPEKLTDQTLTKLVASEIDDTVILEIRLSDNISVKIQRCTASSFKVIRSSSDELPTGCCISFSKVEVGFPFFIRLINQKELKPIALAKVSGVTALKLIAEGE